MSDIKTSKQQKIFDRLSKRFENKIFDSVKVENQQAVSVFLGDAFGMDSIQQNPAYSEWIQDNRCENIQLLAWNGDEVTGCQTGLNCTLNSPFGEIKATWAIDLFVREEWKLKGLGVALIKKLMDQNTVVMGLGISPAAQGMFKRLGWKEMGQVNCYIKPLSANGFSNLKQENFIYSKLLYPFLAIVIRSLTKFKPSLNSNYSIKTVSDFKAHEQELENLFKTINEIPSFYEEKKDINHLQWRFCEHDFTPSSYEINLIFNKEKLEGYLVSKVAIWKEKKALAISEYYGPSDSYQAIVNFCEQQALNAKVDVIFYQGINPDFEKALKKSLFIKRPHGDLFMMYCNDSIENSSEILNPKNWRITLSNSDMDFMFF